MSGTEETFHLTKEDVAKAAQDASKANRKGDVPAGSDAAMAQSIIDKAEKDKPAIIAERQANLPLPDQPPGPGDFNSADARTVNVGAGEQPTGDFSAGNDALRGPATGGSAVREDAELNKTNVQGQGVGREGKDNLDGLPADAVTRGTKKFADGLADTTNRDAPA